MQRYIYGTKHYLRRQTIEIREWRKEREHERESGGAFCCGFCFVGFQYIIFWFVFYFFVVC